LTLYAQTENYDQELANLTFGKQISEARDFYARHKNDIVHPFVIDSYHLISNIYAGKTDSVLSQLPEYLGKYYGNGVDDNLLLYFPTFYWDMGENDNGLKILDVMETFFIRQENGEQNHKEILEQIRETRKSCFGNFDQELGDLLFTKRMEEAQSYYSKNKDCITHPFIIDSYRLISNIYSGKTDSVLSQIPLFISNYYGDVADDNILLYLSSFYWDLGEYGDGLKMLEILEQQDKIRENGEILKGITKSKNHYQAMSPFQKPKIIIPDNTGVARIPMEIDTVIFLNVQYNQTALKTVFDTGMSSYLVMQKKYAEKSNIKMLGPYSESTFNEEAIRSAYGMFDSICIGSLLATNIPVVVIEDDSFFLKHFIDSIILTDENKLNKAKLIINKTEVIMGLPLIKMLNHVSLDLQENELTISLDPGQKVEEESNMYIGNNKLYLRSKLSGLDFTGFLDTGGNLKDTAVVINDDFYRKISSTVNSDSSVFKTDIRIGNNIMDILVKHDPQFPYISEDGFIGFAGLLKKMKKVTFDFDAMRLDCE
jgi:hypothetical protein